MKFNPDIHHRKSIRLKNYEYFNNWLYFITIAIQNKLCLFWNIENSRIKLFESWKMIEKEWLNLEKRFNNIKLHNFVVMPNHFHLIIEIENNVNNLNNRVNTRFTPTGWKFNYNKNSISWIVQAFKSITTNKYIKMVHNWKAETFYKKLWQTNFYENIIRDEKWYNLIYEYIENNVLKWDEDKFYYTEL